MKIQTLAFLIATGATLGLTSFGLAIDREQGLLKRLFNRKSSTSIIKTSNQEPPMVAPGATKHTVKKEAGDKPSKEVAKLNTLSSEEKNLGFELIFNGTDYKGWDNKGNWGIEDGAIARKDKGGGITFTTKKIPDNFELRFEWKVGKGSNSGLYYRPGQYEYQILDNKVHGDGKNPRTSAASLYFCMPPSKDETRPVGEWNEGRIVCKGSVIQHFLNGVKVIDFDYKDAKYAWEVELLKYRGANMEARGANLHIQDHGDPAWFRNLKLRELKDSDPIDKAAVTPAKVPEEIVKREQAYIDNAKKPKTK